MKKFLVILSFAVMCCVAVFPTTVLAATSGDYVYDDNGNGTCIITDYNGVGSNIIIPDTLDGLAVVSIGNWAFYNNSITSVKYQMA